jgi:hypothetical protein
MKDITLANIVLAPDNQRFVPIGPLYIAPVLENAGYNMDFRDYQQCFYLSSSDTGNILYIVSLSFKNLNPSTLTS